MTRLFTWFLLWFVILLIGAALIPAHFSLADGRADGSADGEAGPICTTMEVENNYLPRAYGVNTLSEYNTLLNSPILGQVPLPGGDFVEIGNDWIVIRGKESGTVAIFEVSTQKVTTLKPEVGAYELWYFGLNGSEDHAIFLWNHESTLDLMLYNVKTETLTNVTQFEGSYDVVRPFHPISTYNTDGKTVVYEYSIENSPYMSVYDIATGKTKEIIAEDLTGFSGPFVSGDHIVYSIFSEDTKVYLYQISTGIITPIATSTEAYAPVGLGINDKYVLMMRRYYSGEHEGTRDLVLYEIATGHSMIISEKFMDEQENSYPQIVGDYITWGNFLHIYRYQISTGETRTVLDGQGTEGGYHFPFVVDAAGTVTYVFYGSEQTFMGYRWDCSEPLSSFVLQSPPTHTVITDTVSPVNFTWTASEHALTYGWEAYQASDLRMPVMKVSSVDALAFCDNGLCTFPVAVDDLPDGEYVWNVKAYNMLYQQFSENGYFTFTIDTGADGNLIQNGDFEQSLSPAWTKINSARIKCNTPDKQVAFRGDCTLQLRARGKATQKPDVSMLTLGFGDTVHFEGYVKSSDTARAKVIIKHTNGETRDKIILKQSVTNGYTAFAQSVDLTNDVQTIKVQVIGVRGKSFFDALALSVSSMAEAAGENNAEWNVERSRPELVPPPNFRR